MYKEIEDKELKKICLQILKKFDAVCKENNLKYSIAYGTLLGAVRHKGFIPWDDDIDVIMPREDYEKLLKLQYDDGKYEIKNYRYTPKYYYVFSKMIDKNTYIEEIGRCEKNMGVYIDIFPVDFIENDNKIIEEKANRTLKYKKVIDIICSTTTRRKDDTLIKFIIKKIIKTMSKPFRKIILRYIDYKPISEKSEYCKQLTYASMTKDYFPSDFWNDIIEIEFEQEKVKAFKEYDIYLRKIYGDYMKLPPKERQVSHHNFIAYTV